MLRHNTPLLEGFFADESAIILNRFKMNELNYLQIYDLEAYLLNTVHDRFHTQGYLTAFDFFCIIIWKANRSKSKIANRLLERANTNSLETAVRKLTHGLFLQSTAKDRQKYLFMDWHLWLPMASAILTILFPEEFTVYDKRVCDTLGDFQYLYNLWDFKKLWTGYLNFREAVIRSTPDELSLRDRDRYLWAKSFVQQLEADVSNGFGRKSL
jgi:hypothetical protein